MLLSILKKKLRLCQDTGKMIYVVLHVDFPCSSQNIFYGYKSFAFLTLFPLNILGCCSPDCNHVTFLIILFYFILFLFYSWCCRWSSYTLLLLHLNAFFFYSSFAIVKVFLDCFFHFTKTSVKTEIYSNAKCLKLVLYFLMFMTFLRCDILLNKRWFSECKLYVYVIFSDQISCNKEKFVKQFFKILSRNSWWSLFSLLW